MTATRVLFEIILGQTLSEGFVPVAAEKVYFLASVLQNQMISANLYRRGRPREEKREEIISHPPVSNDEERRSPWNAQTS